MGEPILLIDTSDANGDIDFDAVLAWRGSDGASVAGVICKATEGNGYTDRHFATSWKAIGARPLIRGAYHFAHPDNVRTNDAKLEATFFAQTILARGDFRRGVDFLALDIEEARHVNAGPEFVAWVLDFVRTVTALTGQKCWIYSGGPFFDSHTGALDAATSGELASYPFWLAAYVSDPTRFVPAAWRARGFALHQQSGDQAPKGVMVLHVGGIHGNVDRDVFAGDAATLAAFIASTVIANDNADGAAAPLAPTPLGLHAAASTIADELHRLQAESMAA